LGSEPTQGVAYAVYAAAAAQRVAAAHGRCGAVRYYQAGADGVAGSQQGAEVGVVHRPERGEQVLIRITKLEDGTLKQDRLTDVRFVPLVGGALPEDDRGTSRGAQRASNG